MSVSPECEGWSALPRNRTVLRRLRGVRIEVWNKGSIGRGAIQQPQPRANNRNFGRNLPPEPLVRVRPIGESTGNPPDESPNDLRRRITPMLQLGTITYNIAKDWTLDEILKKLEAL